MKPARSSIAPLTALLLAWTATAAGQDGKTPISPPTAEPAGVPAAKDASPATEAEGEAGTAGADAATTEQAPTTTADTPAETASDAGTAGETRPVEGAPAEDPPLDPVTVRRALAEERARLRAMLDRPAVHQAAPMPPEPATPPDAGAAFAIGVRATTLWNADESYDLFAEEDTKVRGSVFVSYDVWSIRPDLIAAIEVGYGGDTLDGELLQRFDTSLERQVITGGLDVRHVLLPWLQPHARIATGAHYTQTTLSVTTGDGSEQDHWAPMAQLGIGTTLRTPTRLFQSRRGRFASVSLGLKLEVGYLAVPAAEVTIGDARIGDLSQSGPYVDAAVVLRL